jgi:type I restriction enzyme S subunit
MSLPRYPKYKDSGVEWLGEVPEHWDIKRLKRSVRLVTEKAIQKTNSVALENIESWSGRLIPTETEFEGEGTAFKRGDILFGKLRPYLAKAYLAQSDGEAVGDFHVIRPSTDVQGRFLFYQLLNRDSINQIDGSTFGAKMPRVSWEFMANMIFTTPSAEEQTIIAAFLDRETAKIDALVEEQRRLIELLKEKRRAVISHAVTKGLNPHAKMKPSGIEWLGDMPEHWNVMVIKRFSTLQRGHDLTDAERTEGSYPVITSGGFSGTHGSFKARGPGVVTGRYGSTGKLLYVEENFWPHNTSLYVSDFHGNRARYVWYSLQTVDFASHSAKAAVPGIDRNDIHVLPVVVPPSDEQLAIVDFLDCETSKLDELTTEANRAIDLLQERRTALISAAVTGKIDVRGQAGGGGMSLH